MRINEHTAISTSKVLLVPYEAHHVPVYHEWMKDSSIQTATASEPLALEEEYSMQRSWREDPDKLTFIICLPLHQSEGTVKAREQDRSSRMIGDVNMFLRRDDDANAIIGELELMIARKEQQGKGFGRASLEAFSAYILAHKTALVEEYSGSGEDHSLRLEHLSAKIGKGNVRSISLFESFGFKKLQEEPNYFGEFELRIPRDWNESGVCKSRDAYAYQELPYRST